MCYYGTGCEQDAEVEDNPTSFAECYRHKTDEMEGLAALREDSDPLKKLPEHYRNSTHYSWNHPNRYPSCINV